jgi:hypothetical protein
MCLEENKKKVGKVKIKLSLCLIKLDVIKMCAVEVQLQAFITWALDGDEWPASCSDRFTSEPPG